MTELTGETGKHQKKRHQTAVGVVVSAGGDKTIRVVSQHLTRHPKYGKFIRRDTKLAVHDSENVAGVGDKVEIAPCRPISKTKSWRLLRVIESNEMGDAPSPQSGQRNEP